MNYKNKWLCSYETLLFNTPDGDLDIGQYALDGNGTGYYIRTKPKTEAQFAHVDLTYNVAGLKRVNIRSNSHAYYDEFLTAVGATNLWSANSTYAGKDPSQLPSGSVIRIQSTQVKYNGLRYMPDYPQPSRTEVITVIPPEEPILPSQPAHSISLDATSNSGYLVGVSSYSWSHTCAGTNLLLVFGDSSGRTATDITVSGVTYNTAALIPVKSDVAFDGTYYYRSSLLYLIAPATGAKTVAVTLSGTVGATCGGVVSYTGMKQSGQPDANNGANGNSTTATVDVTTVANNSWVFDVLSCWWSIGITCNNTQRWNSQNREGGADTNAPKTPAGSQTMSWGLGASAIYWAISAASFAPAAKPFSHGYIIG